MNDVQQYIRLTKDWSLRKLSLAPPEEAWALQYKGMDWLKVSEFLGKGNSTIDTDIHKFADAVRELKNDNTGKAQGPS